MCSLFISHWSRKLQLLFNAHYSPSLEMLLFLYFSLVISLIFSSSYYIFFIKIVQLFFFSFQRVIRCDWKRKYPVWKRFLFFIQLCIKIFSNYNWRLILVTFNFLIKELLSLHIVWLCTNVVRDTDEIFFLIDIHYKIYQTRIFPISIGQ